MTKRLLALVGIVLMLMSSLVFQASAQPSAIDLMAQTGPFQIIARQSGKCLDVPDGSQANNIVVQQYHCHGGDNQKWYLATSSTAAPAYFISAKHSRKYLDVWDRSKADHAAIQQYTFNGGDNQLWYLIPFGSSGYYLIVSKNSLKCLDVPDGSRADQVHLQQSLCHGGTNQQFRLQ